MLLYLRYFVHPGEYLKSDYGFTLQKDSQLTEILNFHIGKIIESGLLDQLEKKYFENFSFEDGCSHESSGDIFNTIFCFAQLAAGCVFAVFILCLENMFGKGSKKLRGGHINVVKTTSSSVDQNKKQFRKGGNLDSKFSLPKEK